jgi:hypothetical protein
MSGIAGILDDTLADLPGCTPPARLAGAVA